MVEIERMSAGALAGKCIVIIGGTTGLGLSAAKACVGAGGSVVVVGRNETSARAAETELGKAGVSMIGDAADSATAPQAIELAREHFGDLDGLYHVAGGSGRRMGDGPLHEMTDEGLRATLELNLHSLIFSNRAAVRHFLDAKKPGSILNIGSVLGWSPSPHFFATHAYAAAKAAIVGFTKSIAAYYAGKDIRANVLAPAVVETPMAQRAAGGETILKFLKTKQRLDGGRIGQAEDCDAAAVYFLSEQSKYVTGQVLAIDGGWSVSEGQIPQA